MLRLQSVSTHHWIIYTRVSPRWTSALCEGIDFPSSLYYRCLFIVWPSCFVQRKFEHDCVVKKWAAAVWRHTGKSLRMNSSLCLLTSPRCRVLQHDGENVLGSVASAAVSTLLMWSCTALETLIIWRGRFVYAVAQECLPAERLLFLCSVFPEENAHSANKNAYVSQNLSW